MGSVGKPKKGTNKCTLLASSFPLRCEYSVLHVKAYTIPNAHTAMHKNFNVVHDIPEQNSQTYAIPLAKRTILQLYSTTFP